MRYTEARMTDVSMLLMEGIGEDAIDFRPTYNEEDEEPVVLPGAFPNLLANGAMGIAVGMATSIPPHNVAELCDGALHLIAKPQASIAELMAHIKGPDFPTSGILVEPHASMLAAYESGRGSFRLRSRWKREEGSRGAYVLVVTEIPWQVQKSRLVEKVAELLLQRKLPLLEDIRDESAQDIRIVLEPKNRSVDPELLMESLFRLTDFETRQPLNMNVLTLGKIPQVLSLKQVLQQWLDHRCEVLERRSRHRLAEIARRVDILGGYLVAYLNIDEVIAIIRDKEEPAPVLIQRFDLTPTQAEAILNMRLRSLRKLEEFEIHKEFDALKIEQEKLEALLASPIRQWKAIAADITKIKQRFAADSLLGKRRTDFAEAPDRDMEDIQQAMIEKEPVTIVISQKGWVRALKGHMSDYQSLSFKEGDGLKCAFPAQTTDKIVIASTGGKFYTLAASSLPGGRGAGEPIRLMVDIDNDQDILTAFVHDPQGKKLLVSKQAYGFVVPEADLVANTRKGKQVMNVKMPDEMRLCVNVAGDHVAIVGQNRKMLIFPLLQIPQMSRGKGVRLQHYRDGEVAAITVFAQDEGLKWQDGAGRSFTKTGTELAEWMGNRAGVGRSVPKGFPRQDAFG